MPSADDWIDQGLAAHEAGALDQAAAAYREALSVDANHPDALNLLGVVAHQQGDPAEAIRLIQLAIDQDSEAADFHANLAEAYRADRQYGPAVNAYAKSAQLDGSNGAVWANLGTLLQIGKRAAEAVGAWKHAVECEPTSAEYHNNYGRLLMVVNRPGEAIGPLERALELKPGFRAAIENLAEALGLAGRAADGADVAKRLTELAPTDAAAWTFYAAACNDADRMHDALDAAREAIRLDPDRYNAHYVMGQSLAKMGEQAGAAMAYAKVTELRPKAAGAYANLGLAALNAGRLEEAAEALEEASDISPEFPEAWYNLAVVHERMGQFSKAIEFAEKARALRPDWAAATNMIGLLQLHLGRHAEAEQEFHHALELDPAFLPALAGLGNVLGERGDHEAALVHFRRCRELQPNDAPAFNTMMMSALAAGHLSTEFVIELHREFGRQFDRPATHWDNDKTPDRRLRIGYVSPDLKAHSVAFFLAGLMGNHDHSQFEIIAYDDTHKPDIVSGMLRTYCDAWHRVVGMKHDRLAELIREHKIDILVDLAGHTSSNRLMVFAQKPAPVQISYLGYPGTSGLKAIDYRLTDALADPPGLTDDHHSEKLIRLPGSFLAYAAVPHAPDVAPLPALQNGYVTFTSFNNTTKMHPGVYALWARVLHAVPNSKLIIKANGFADEVLKQRVHRQFAEAGIDTERVILLAKLPTMVEHLAIYGRCDLALDTFPYNGTTTTCEAMYMGVPTVGLAGAMHVGRVGLSILTNMGLADWIAENESQYIEIAAKKAADLPALAELRAGLRQRMLNSPIMDSKSLAKHVEAAYRTAWQGYCKST